MVIYHSVRLSFLLTDSHYLLMPKQHQAFHQRSYLLYLQILFIGWRISRANRKPYYFIQLHYFLVIIIFPYETAIQCPRSTKKEKKTNKKEHQVLHRMQYNSRGSSQSDLFRYASAFFGLPLIAMLC